MAVWEEKTYIPEYGGNRYPTGASVANNFGRFWNDITGASANNEFNAIQAHYNRLWESDEAAIARNFNSAEAQKQRDWETEMSNTAYQRAVADMRNAGLNPASLGGEGTSAPASTPSGSAASAASPSASAASAASGSGAGILRALGNAARSAIFKAASAKMTNSAFKAKDGASIVKNTKKIEKSASSALKATSSKNELAEFEKMMENLRKYEQEGLKNQ